jgi:hypothetical protein
VWTAERDPSRFFGAATVVVEKVAPRVLPLARQPRKITAVLWTAIAAALLLMQLRELVSQLRSPQASTAMPLNGYPVRVGLRTRALRPQRSRTAKSLFH